MTDQMLKIDDRLKASDVQEGDRVIMAIRAHNYQQTGSGLTGTVTEALSDRDAEILDDEDMGKPMADVTVESDYGERWTWNVDNGYVIGPNGDGRRTDIGKMRGFWPPDAGANSGDR